MHTASGKPVEVVFPEGSVRIGKIESEQPGGAMGRRHGTPQSTTAAPGNSQRPVL